MRCVSKPLGYQEQVDPHRLLSHTRIATLKMYCQLNCSLPSNNSVEGLFVYTPMLDVSAALGNAIALQTRVPKHFEGEGVVIV